MKTIPTFTQTIREFRSTNGLTAKQAAALVPFLSTRTWEAWEAGTRQPPEWVQGLLLAALGASSAAPDGIQRDDA